MGDSCAARQTQNRTYGPRGSWPAEPRGSGNGYGREFAAVGRTSSRLGKGKGPPNPAVIDTSQIYRRKPTPEENNALRELFDGDDQFWEGMQVVRPRTLQVKHRKEEDTAPFLYNDR